VEWPDDLIIQDYRIEPNELVIHSQVEPKNSQPILVNNASIYTTEYIDILKQLELNKITISRVWTISTNNVNVATYTQQIEVEITEFAALVQASTISDRPIPDVELNNDIFTNEEGVAFVEADEIIMVQREDDTFNGLTIRDLILIQNHITGITELDELQLKAADFNQDGQVSALDLLEIRKTIQEVSTAIDSEWFFIDYTDSLNLAIQPKANLIGFKRGDVDDDASLGNTPNPLPKSLFLEDALINVGESYVTKIFYGGEDLIRGAEVHIYYDQSLITVTSLDEELTGASLDYNLDKPGEIHFILDDPLASGIDFTNENFINVSFSANSNGLLSQAINNVQSRTSYIIDLNYDLVQVDLEFVDQIDTGTKDVSAHNEIFEVYPNPTSDNLTFDFIDGTPSNFTINIYNISGQLLAEHYNKNNIDVSALQSGMHIYVK